MTSSTQKCEGASERKRRGSAESRIRVTAMMLTCGDGGGGGVKDEDVGDYGTNHDDEVRRQDASCGCDHSHNEPVEKTKQVT